MKSNYHAANNCIIQQTIYKGPNSFDFVPVIRERTNRVGSQVCRYRAREIGTLGKWVRRNREMEKYRSLDRYRQSSSTARLRRHWQGWTTAMSGPTNWRPFWGIYQRTKSMTSQTKMEQSFLARHWDLIVDSTMLPPSCRFVLNEVFL